MMVYDDLVEYLIKVELRNANICWCMWNVNGNTTFISNLLNCNHTAPSVCGGYVDI
jgi:hypothetical protein